MLNVAPAAPERKQLQPNAMKRTSDWICSLDIPSDITVQVGDATFSLNKSLLASKCGNVRKLLSGSNGLLIQIPDIPGGAEAFELAAKFCYGINLDITFENVAELRCAAEYLGMTEDCSYGNLISKTEAYLEEVTLATLSSAVTVLKRSEDLIPTSEKVKLVSRCIDAIAYLACNGDQADDSSQENANLSFNMQHRAVVDWWAEELLVLRVDIFQRVLMAIEARGVKRHALGPVIMLYAQKSLRGLDIFGKSRKKIEPRKEHEKRVVLETIVGLLPKEKNAMSVSFLSMLLRAALYLETTVACQLDLEKRIASQLEQAVLDDILIPSFSSNSAALFDVDAVQRILMNYLESEADGSHFEDEYISPPLNSVERVGRLLESYLEEIASDQNLTMETFIGLAELIPEQARITEDGMYRAIDIYLKAHPLLSDNERKKICGLMDCQKLSREACAHAAQNDRLPVQIVVQVLYHEQQRLQDSTTTSYMGGGDSPALSHKTTSHSFGNQTQMEELSRLRRENEDLKLELAKTKMQLMELQKPPLHNSPRELQKPPLHNNSPYHEKPPLPKKSIMNSVSKKLGRLNPFLRVDGSNPLSGKPRTKPPKDRRHSIS